MVWVDEAKSSKQRARTSSGNNDRFDRSLSHLFSVAACCVSTGQGPRQQGAGHALVFLINFEKTPVERVRTS